MSEEAELSREQRKEEGKRKKRQRIQESGGVRPRNGGSTSTSPSKKNRPKKQKNNHGNSHASPLSSSSSKHRFGRVMENVPCRNKPRYSTISIALPGSVLVNCQTKELRTLLVGQIARAATIYHVDEIIVFDDKLGNNSNIDNDNHGGRGWRDFKKQQRHQRSADKEKEGETLADGNKEDHPRKEEEQEERKHIHPRSNPQEFMARLLQYCECPQYLRRSFFPMHPDLQFVGLLAPVDAPHHVRADDHCKYREGVVLPKTSSKGNSLVNCGIRNRPVEIDRKISPGVRCTVQIDLSVYKKPGLIHGTVVSPSAPREDNGTYWGFTTRLASSIHDVFEGCPYPEGYDLKIGTSERGDKSVEDKSFGIKDTFEHSLIVFGGVAGIEECVDADETMKISGSQSKTLFDMWLNTCPFQGSRTIRTEEAVMISLAKLSPFLIKAARDKPLEDSEEEEEQAVEFSDDSPSDESSEDDGSDSDESAH